jgi:hypothetical protein
MKARDLLKNGESAVVLFTRGARFTVKANGSGSSGNWRIGANRNPDKVIVYHRLGSANDNEVFIANWVGIKDSSEENLSVIMFDKCKSAGPTTLNWFKFAEGGTQAVRYLDGHGENA